MAGAKICFCSHTDRVVDIRSSATPFPALQIILAVAGAITIKSISNARSTCSRPPFGSFENNQSYHLHYRQNHVKQIPVETLPPIQAHWGDGDSIVL